MRDDVAAISRMPHVESFTFTIKRNPPSGEPMRFEWSAMVRGERYVSCIDVSPEPHHAVNSPEDGAHLILLNAVQTLEALA